MATSILRQSFDKNEKLLSSNYTVLRKHNYFNEFFSDLEYNNDVLLMSLHLEKTSTFQLREICHQYDQ